MIIENFTMLIRTIGDKSYNSKIKINFEIP